MKTIDTCVNRVLGKCKKCTINYDPNKRPNNLDCPAYVAVKIMEYEVKNVYRK